MKLQLQTIKSLVKSIPSGQDADKEVIGNLSSACEVFEDICFKAFSSIPKQEGFPDTINWCRVSVTKMADMLYTKIQSKTVAQAFLLPIINLLGSMEEEYGELLDHRHAIPRCNLPDFRHTVQLQLKEISAMLLQKGIHPALINQLEKAYEDLFQPGRYPDVCYAEKEYFHIFIGQLRKLAEDKRKKDWQLRLKRMLIKYNFNHMGIYNVLKKQMDEHIQQAKSFQEKISVINELIICLQEIDPVEGLSYHSLNSVSMREHFFAHLGVRRVEALDNEKMMRSQHYALYAKLSKELSVYEMAIEFHYDYEEGLYAAYPTKKAAAEAYIAHNRSKEVEDISVASILKFDKIAHMSAAIKHYQRINRILHKLSADFNL